MFIASGLKQDDCPKCGGDGETEASAFLKNGFVLFPYGFKARPKA